MSTTLPTPNGDAAAALAARLRALLDAGPPQARRGENSAQAADRLAETRRLAEDIEAIRTGLATAFADAHGWRATTAPLAVKELARRAPPGGNWHRPAREWLGTLFAPTFYRDARRRACAAVAHPLAEQIERDRLEIEAWAAERDLTVTFPAFPSWHDPVRSVLAVFEPAEPAGRAEVLPAAAQKSQQAAPAPPTAPDLDALRPEEVGEEPVPPASDLVPETEMGQPVGNPDTLPAAPTMRPVASVDLGDVTPRDLTDEEDPDFDVVDPTELLIDEAYQRDLTLKSLALIRRIVENWSWSRFKVPTVVRVDGRLHVLDGQHSAIAAASHPGIGAIPVLIAKLPGAADRAAAFVSHATERLPTTIVQVHHAAVQAGDGEAVAIDRVCRAAGVDLVAFPPPRSAYRPRQSIALSAVRRVVDKQGPERATEILSALAAADLAPITADHIRAAEALLTDPDFAADFTPERVADGFRALDAKAMAEAKALAVTKQMPLWRGMVAVIYRGRKARPKGGRRGEGLAA